jgi:hypothetical protein
VTRINVYATGNADKFGYEPPALAGHFESSKAEWWSDMDHNSNGSGGTGRGQAILRTAGGKWVLEHWTCWRGEESTYAYTDGDTAKDWLLRNNEDMAVAKYFGPIPEEEDRRPGRPAVGQAINVRPGDELLAVLNAYAGEHGHSRAEAIRILLGEALTAARPYTVTVRAIDTGRREVDSRHATLGAAVEAMRDVEDLEGMPSYLARVEHDGRPVDVEAMSPVSWTST